MNSFFSNKKILVTGGSGFLGSFVVEKLCESGADRSLIRIPRSSEHDLRQWSVCHELVQGQDLIIHLAATVGGIGFNQQHPGKLFYDNAIMGIQLMEAARQAGVPKFVAVGTICAYPKLAPIPFREEDLWNGYPEETNAPYGLAKKMLLVQAQAYRQEYGYNAIYLLPVNLYGPRDNFNPTSSHVIPALIVKVEEAIKRRSDEVEVWGTGQATREFLYVEDAAEGIVKAVEHYNKPEPVNLGASFEISIADLVEEIKQVAGYTGSVRWDHTKPDGQPRRKLDTSRAQREFDFTSHTSFHNGLQKTIEWYRLNQA